MRTKGFNYETLAAEYLVRQGLRVIQQNYTCKAGEIDLIMQDKNYLAFVEVRFRQTSHYSSAVESITKGKQTKIIKTAKYFLSQTKQWHCPCRFDVVTFDQNSTQTSPSLNWIKNAFEGSAW